MGMRLNQHGLRGGIMRQVCVCIMKVELVYLQKGETLNDGYPIDTPTEKSVFEALGLKYLTPEERDHI